MQKENIRTIAQAEREKYQKDTREALKILETKNA
jgi:hypothetical protein